MKLLKNRAFAIAVAAVCAAIAVFIGLSSAIPSQDRSNAFVFDGAGVLSSQTKDRIYSMNKNGSDGNFYVLTVKSTGRYDLYDWALKTAEEWGISSYSSIILAMQPSKSDYQLIYGSDFEAALTGNNFSAFLGKYIEPYFAAGDYNGAALNFCSGAAKLDADWDPDYYDYGHDEDPSVFAGIVALIIIFVFVIIIAAIVSAVKNSTAGMQSGSSGTAGSRSGSSGFFWGYMLGSSRHRHIHIPPPGPHGGFGGFGAAPHRPSSSFRPSSGSSHRPGGFSGGGRSGGGFSGGGRSGGGFSGGGRRR